ncbi:lysophospholipid acyltransferase family protein [Corynebacterium cystitidis]|uniref:lysophospholipid acyltransferase family protein n=1 Tax=Corynebacterium cystitidis TaxID=35757 RepID=UPI00211E4D47|nr:lysophospholipid acyltransferase family protein [Corynebacterium cystitidis]
MQNKWYWFYKHILLGPLAWVWSRPTTEGLDNIPKQGAAIVASNHQSVYDSFIFPLVCDRQLTFPAKSEYFTAPGLKGRIKKWFFTSVGQVPVYRGSEGAGENMLQAARGVLERGDLLGIYPEGTRAPDKRIYKGKTGMARVAMDTGALVIPLGMINSADANPIGTTFIRPVQVKMRVGEAIDPHEWARSNGFDPGSNEVMRPFTDYVMAKLTELTGFDYVNVYATDVKKSLAEGKGYPPEARPH